MRPLILIMLLYTNFVFSQEITFTPIPYKDFSDTVEIPASIDRVECLLDSIVVSFASRGVVYNQLLMHILSVQGANHTFFTDSTFRKGALFFLSCITPYKTKVCGNRIISTRLHFDSHQIAYLISRIDSHGNSFVRNMQRLSVVQDSLFQILSKNLHMIKLNTKRRNSAWLRPDNIFHQIALFEAFSSFQTGFRYISESEYTLSSLHLSSYLRLFPNDTYARSLLCYTFRCSGKYEAAINLSYELYSDDPVLLQNEIGQAYLITGLPLSARTHFLYLLKTNPSNLDALHGIGLIFFILDDLDSAFIYWNRALSIDPNAATILGNLATIYFAWGDSLKARDFYRKSLALRSDPLTLYRFGYSDLAYRLNPHFLNDALFNRINNLKKNRMRKISFYEPIGNQYFAYRDYNRAVKYYDSALSCSSTDTTMVLSILQKKAFSLYQIGKYHLSIAAYKQLIGRSHNLPYNYSILSDLYSVLNNTTMALLYARLAYNLDTSSISYLDQLAWSYFRHNRLDSAIAFYTKILTIDCNNSKALRRMAEIYLAKHDFKKFSFFTERCLLGDPINDRVLFLYGKELLKKNDLSKGLPMLKKASSLGNSEAGLLLKRLHY